jgi:serine/threonine protein kinase
VCTISVRSRTLLRENAKGAIYAGKSKRTSGDVAVKLLSPDLVRYPGYRDSFQREAEIATKLRHPNICRVIDYGPTTLHLSNDVAVETQFLCYELMTGGSLAKRWRRLKRSRASASPIG